MSTSTFMGLQISKNGLMAHQRALHITGHNISNAENKEYSRQKAVITTMDPLYLPALNRSMTAGNIGQGAMVSAIERVRDTFIDDRIMAEKKILGYWETRNNFIYQIETIYNEPGEGSLRAAQDEFWRAWEELSKYPEERSTREVVKERGERLSNDIQNIYRQLYELRHNANREVDFTVSRINNYAREISDLNQRIVKAEAVGDRPNDLLDRRDAVIEKLAELIDISVSRSDRDEIIVYTNGENLVQGGIVRQMRTVNDAANDGMSRVVWDQTGTAVNPDSGALGSLLEIRDSVLRENINDINAFAVNLMDMTNEIHRDGYGRNGETGINFFEYLPVTNNIDGNHDFTNDGIEDMTAIFKVAGNNSIDASAAIGITGTLTFARNDAMESRVNIDYNESDSTLSVMKRINNADIGVVAYLDHNSRLALKAIAAEDDHRKSFMIRHMEDSGQFLTGFTGVLRESGPPGAFNYNRVNDIMKLLPERDNITLTPEYNPAAHISVSKPVINNVDNIAASSAKGAGGTGGPETDSAIGDGTNALRLAAVRNKDSMVDKNTSFGDFYTSLISRIGVQGEEADERIKNLNTLMKNLVNMRESVSGVNLDEEMISMVAFQHGYNASARMLSTVNEMLETIIFLGR